MAAAATASTGMVRERAPVRKMVTTKGAFSLALVSWNLKPHLPAPIAMSFLFLYSVGI